MNTSNVVQDLKKVLSLIAFSNLCDFDKQKQQLSFMFKEEPFPWENIWEIQVWFQSTMYVLPDIASRLIRNSKCEVQALLISLSKKEQ